MRQLREKNHAADMFFTIALFGVFLVTAVMVIAIGAGAYRNTARDTSRNYNLRTSLAYVGEKVRQSDVGGSVEKGSIGGCPALVIRQTYADTPYLTYIYASGGYLRELFVREGVEMEPEGGTGLVPVQDFTVEEEAEGVLKVIVTDEDGNPSSLLLHTMSGALPESGVEE